MSSHEEIGVSPNASQPQSVTFGRMVFRPPTEEERWFFTKDRLRLALRYATERGWSVFPVPIGTKKSHKSARFSDGRNWGMTNDPNEIRQDFRQWPDAGIGIPTGADNRIWVTEADTPKGHGVDGIASMKALQDKHGPLPRTLQAISPSGSIHWYWRYPDTGTVITSSTSRIAIGVDVKGEGGMVVAPPTVKPDGGVYRWFNNNPIADAPDWLLKAAVEACGPSAERERETGERERSAPPAPIEMIATAMAVIPNEEPNWEWWNKVGMAVFRATGGSDAGLRIFDAWSRKCAVAYDERDTEEKWGKFFTTPPDNIGSGSIYHWANEAHPDWDIEITARPESETAKCIRDFLKAVGVEHIPIPIIKLVSGQLARIVDETEAALLKAGVPIMVRAGMLVHPIQETFPAADDQKTQATILRPLRLENAAYMVNKQAAVFIRYDERRKRWVKTDPPDRIAATLLHKGQWAFPKVTGVVTAPTMRPDGTILDCPGHDPSTQLWYAPDAFLHMPPIKDKPTKGDALAALELIDGLLAGWKFVDDLDRSVALAAMLTPHLRPACDVVPMFLFLAHTAGSGKSFLTDLISVTAHGRKAPAISKAATEEELEKRLGALVLAGVPVINIDNCTANLSGTTLCQVTERQVVRIRILGRSEMPECEYRGAVFANGNNITAEGDLTRRTLVSHIDPEVERPELRRFAFDPIERVARDRGTYIAAALTIARAYLVSGLRVECDPLASYGRWSKVVREPLIWLGKEDPVKSMDEIREEDPVRAAVRDLYALWREQLGEDAYTAAEMLEKVLKREDLNKPESESQTQFRRLLADQAGGFRGEIDARRVGMWLQSVYGQVHDGFRLDKVKERGKSGAKYALRAVNRQRGREG
jgi:putative DNA primase/helicase